MSEHIAAPRVVATAAALEAIPGLRADRGLLTFHQSGGCCDGSLPICLDAGELIVGDGDVRLGDVGGCQFYIDARQDAAWREPRLILDVAPGAPEGLLASRRRRSAFRHADPHFRLGVTGSATRRATGSQSVPACR